jgi:hypothetical protein
MGRIVEIEETYNGPWSEELNLLALTRMPWSMSTSNPKTRSRSGGQRGDQPRCHSLTTLRHWILGNAGKSGLDLDDFYWFERYGAAEYIEFSLTSDHRRRQGQR